MRINLLVIFLVGIGLFSQAVMAGVDGSIEGTVFDNQGVAASNIKVQLESMSGHKLKEAKTSVTGEFSFFPITLGDYQIVVKASGFSPSIMQIHVSSGATSQVEVHLVPDTGKEMVVTVRAKKRLINQSSSNSRTVVTSKQIEQMPEGDNITLPKLLSDTMPGVVQGPFGQSYIRGNHANIQYQVDGVQLPDSPSNTFGEAFTPRNIDHMEVITGGASAEYGERLAAVVNIVTKSGPENPGGEAELSYGSYNTFEPFMLYGGSNPSGHVHYFVSASFNRTDRGLDTPQPKSSTDQMQGGTDAIHDFSWGNNEFAKIDWLANNSNKISFIGFNSFNFYQIPTYPDTFSKTDPLFNSTSAYGDGPLPYFPSGTDDSQTEMNSFFQAVWKHTFTDTSFLQVAPYYKYSYVGVGNDLTNDLAAAFPPNIIATQAQNAAASMAESRRTDNFGLKADYTDRFNSQNLFKTGVQAQSSESQGYLTVTQAYNGGNQTASTDNSPTFGNFESVYAQDEYTFSKGLVLSGGLRFDATQFTFAGYTPTESMLQPRVGVSYMATDTTKLHVFYGQLFQPAPTENLRDTFQQLAGNTQQLAPYDIKAERDDYYEAGVDQQLGQNYVAKLNYYYKFAQNMLDDAELLNTPIAQPFNFATGIAYGSEFSLIGKINDNWSAYFNYSYEITMGKGISGGLFTAQFVNQTQSPGYQYLDHCQIQTANAGVAFNTDTYFWNLVGLYGSGLRTGPNNSDSLPDHVTFDTTVGYQFHGNNVWSRMKVSGDVLNILNNVYPINIANGFNGSQYAAGREFFVRLHTTF